MTGVEIFTGVPEGGLRSARLPGPSPQGWSTLPVCCCGGAGEVSHCGHEDNIPFSPSILHSFLKNKLSRWALFSRL